MEIRNSPYMGLVENTSKIKRLRFLPIRKTLVPHSGQVPFRAGLPFFSVVSCGSLISLFSLHFTQYAVAIISFNKQRRIYQDAVNFF